MSGSASPQRPLSFSNNNRASPFRRPDSSSPRSPSTVRATTPQPGSPLKTATSAADNVLPTLQNNSNIPTFSPGPAQDRSWLTTRGATMDNAISLSPPTSPSRNRNHLARDVLAVSTAGLDGSADGSERGSPASAHTVRPHISSRSNTAPVPVLPGGHLQASPQITARTNTSHLPKSTNADPLSTIPHQHLHTMRESFAVLDRNNVGTINSADVLAQLTELGLDTSPAALAEFFPGSQNGTMNLSTYLNNLATDLSALSRQDELLNALSAFDDDDSGQIDIGDLCDALAHVVPDAGSGPRLTVAEIERCLHGFTGKRMFKKGAMGNGAGLGGGEKRDVFRYQDFVAGIWGGGEQAAAVKEGA